jgi:hypothetical protein
LLQGNSPGHQRRRRRQRRRSLAGQSPIHHLPQLSIHHALSVVLRCDASSTRCRRLRQRLCSCFTCTESASCGGGRPRSSNNDDKNNNTTVWEHENCTHHACHQGHQLRGGIEEVSADRVHARRLEEAPISRSVPVLLAVPVQQRGVQKFGSRGVGHHRHCHHRVLVQCRGERIHRLGRCPTRRPPHQFVAPPTGTAPRPFHAEQPLPGSAFGYVHQIRITRQTLRAPIFFGFLFELHGFSGPPLPPFTHVASPAPLFLSFLLVYTCI